MKANYTNYPFNQTPSLNSLKQAVLNQLSGEFGANRAALHSAVNQAEALAWETPFPLLFLPVLAAEKARENSHRQQLAVSVPQFAPTNEFTLPESLTLAA